MTSMSGRSLFEVNLVYCKKEEVMEDVTEKVLGL